MKHNLTASSPSWGILIIRHTSSNSLMKNYKSSESRPWSFEKLLMNCGLSSKLLPLTSGSRMQDGRDALMGQNLSCRDVVWFITGSDFEGELLLINLDVFGSLDQTDKYNQDHKQVHPSLL